MTASFLFFSNSSIPFKTTLSVGSGIVSSNILEFNPALFKTFCNYVTYPNCTICLSVTINSDLIDPKILIISGSWFKLPFPT